MSVVKLLLPGLLTTLTLVYGSAQADEAKADVTPLSDFMGCWMMKGKPAGTVLQTDDSKKDSYSLSEQLAMIKIESVEKGAAFGQLVKGTVDAWSDEKKYYIPTIYFFGVYDPVRGVVLTDASIYLVDGRLVFLLHRTTDAEAVRTSRVLDKVDCSEIAKTRRKIHSEYKAFE